MLKSSSTTVLLLLLLHKNTDYYRPDNLWIKWLARKKTTNLLMAKKFMGKFLSKWDFQCCQISEFQKRPNYFGNGQIGRILGRLLEISPPPPTCQCAAPRPTWSGPAHLPPASLSPKKQNKKSVLFYKREKKSLLLLTPIFSLISSSSNGYSCYVIFSLNSIKYFFCLLVITL